MSIPVYRLIRSRRKTLAIEITRDAQLVVRAPRNLPQQHIDRFVAEKEAWIAQAMERQRQRSAAHPEPTEAQWEALLQQARKVIPPRLEAYSRQMGLVPTALHFSRARTRFGSCSSKDSITFSLRLMEYPPEAIDYVIVHELAHIRHKNHGPDFWRLVASVLPDYQARRALLKQ